MSDKPSAAEQAFEELWKDSHFSSDVYNRCKHFYLEADADATDRTARRCVDKCVDHPSIARAIAKEFGLD